MASGPFNFTKMYNTERRYRWRDFEIKGQYTIYRMLSVAAIVGFATYILTVTLLGDNAIVAGIGVAVTLILAQYELYRTDWQSKLYQQLGTIAPNFFILTFVEDEVRLQLPFFVRKGVYYVRKTKHRKKRRHH